MFFWYGPFSKSLLNLLQDCFCFYVLAFWHEAWGVLVPWPRTEHPPPALEREVLTAGPPAKSLVIFSRNSYNRAKYLHVVLLTSTHRGCYWRVLECRRDTPNLQTMGKITLPKQNSMYNCFFIEQWIFFWFAKDVENRKLRIIAFK